MSYISTVREFVTENFLFGDEEALEDDASFLESDIVDSTGILELINFLEETYDIRIEDDELTPENLDSVTRVARFLEHKLSGVEA